MESAPRCFCSMKWVRVFLSPATVALNLPAVSIYCPDLRKALRGRSVLPRKCSIISPARAQTRTAWSGDQRTNHKTTAPSYKWGPVLQIATIITKFEFDRTSCLTVFLAQRPSSICRKSPKHKILSALENWNGRKHLQDCKHIYLKFQVFLTDVFEKKNNNN